MRVLIEEYQYGVSAVRDILHGIDALENVEGRVSVHYVGYFYNDLLHDCVFILPKVLLKDVGGRELVFGKYAPEAIANLDQSNPLTPVERNFLYKFAVWIYRAIVVYKNDRRSDPSIIYHTHMAKVGGGTRRLSNTYLDILLELLLFNRENRSFFFTTIKNLHSGHNKINWSRTIATTPAIVQGGSPIYLRPVNKKRQVNFDEELLVIFYSILNYIADSYGFPCEVSCQFQLITGRRFEHYLDGFGRVRLRQIKYKYFSDVALRLWHLCYAFFDEARQVRVSTSQREYLLAKNFYVVFEAIIDELIGDNPLPDGMQKKQEDGKIVDHLFTARSLIDNDDRRTYYIGDSKYYKMGHELGQESIYKQYTYARNVIQWNLDIFNSGRETSSGVSLRDDVTEGYNVIPNFFISAKMDEAFDYGSDGIERTDRTRNRHKQEHFHNRLFDRDTLLLFHYDVNFLFVLSLYARDNRSQKERWKTLVRNKFRQEIQSWLQQDYDFYAMRAHPDVNAEEYVRTHFRQMLGKVYTPFADQSVFSLALDNDATCRAENEALLAQLGQSFYVVRCPLGQSPADVLPPAERTIQVAPGGRDDIALCVTMEGQRFDRAIEKIMQTRTVGIAMQMNGATLSLVEGFTTAKYLLVHNKGDRYQAFFLDGRGPRLIPGGPSTPDMLVTKQGADLYLTYAVDTSFTVHTPPLSLKPITSLRVESYSPQLMSLAALSAT